MTCHYTATNHSTSLEDLQCDIVYLSDVLWEQEQLYAPEKYPDFIASLWEKEILDENLYVNLYVVHCFRAR